MTAVIDNLLNAGPGWLSDIFRIQVYFDADVCETNPLQSAVRRTEDDDVEAHAELPVFAAGAAVQGFVRITAPPNRTVAHNGVTARLRSSLVTADEAVSREFVDLSVDIIPDGKITGTLDLPFLFPGSMTSQLVDTYEGSLFSVRHVINVTVTRPWYTFAVQNAAPFSVQRVYDLPPRCTYTVETSSSGETTADLLEALPSTASAPHSEAAVDDEDATTSPEVAVNVANLPAAGDAVVSATAAAVATKIDVASAPSAATTEPASTVVAEAGGAAAAPTKAVPPPPAAEKAQTDVSGAAKGGSNAGKLPRAAAAEPSPTAAAAANPLAAVAGRPAGNRVLDRQLALYGPQQIVIADTEDGSVIDFQFDKGCYELSDQLQGSIAFTGCVRPVLLVRLAVLKVEYCNGETDDEVVFDETILDARRWRARKLEETRRMGVSYSSHSAPKEAAVAAAAAARVSKAHEEAEEAEAEGVGAASSAPKAAGGDAAADGSKDAAVAAAARPAAAAAAVVPDGADTAEEDDEEEARPDDEGDDEADDDDKAAPEDADGEEEEDEFKEQAGEGVEGGEEGTPEWTDADWMPSEEDLAGVEGEEGADGQLFVDPDVPVVGDVVLSVELNFGQVPSVSSTMAIKLPDGEDDDETVEVGSAGGGRSRSSSVGSRLVSAGGAAGEDVSVRYFLRLTTYTRFATAARRWASREVVLYRDRLYGFLIPPGEVPRPLYLRPKPKAGAQAGAVGAASKGGKPTAKKAPSSGAAAAAAKGSINGGGGASPVLGGGKVAPLPELPVERIIGAGATSPRLAADGAAHFVQPATAAAARVGEPGQSAGAAAGGGSPLARVPPAPLDGDAEAAMAGRAGNAASAAVASRGAAGGLEPSAGRSKADVPSSPLRRAVGSAGASV